MASMEHYENIGKSMLEFYTKQLFCDASIAHQDSYTKCHKAVLASASDYFYYQFNKAGCNVIEVNEIAIDIVHTTLLFMYQGFCHITSENVCQLLYLADIWALYKLKKNCVSFIITTETIDNCLQYYDACFKQNCDNVGLDLQAKYIYGILGDLVVHNAFKKLALNVFYDLIWRGRKLNLGQNEILFEILLKYGTTHPAVDLGVFMYIIDFEKMSKHYLLNVVLESEILPTDIRNFVYNYTEQCFKGKKRNFAEMSCDE